jgi:hypothetical protein
MRLTKQKLRLIIENFLLEGKINYTPKSEWSKNKKNAIKKALYGNPKEKSNLKKALEEKWDGKVPLCKTCSAFDTSKEAKEAGAKSGTGYCHAFNFACSAKNSCTGWSPKKG